MVKTDIHFDTENELICIRNVDETGAVIATLPQIRLKLVDLQSADTVSGGVPIQMVCRRAHYTDPSGAKKRIYVLATIAEDDSTDDGHSITAVDAGDAVQDLTIGGGGGGKQRMRVKNGYSDYLECRTWDGTTEGTTPIYVALQPHLRSSLSGETINGNPITFTYPVMHRRIAHDGLGVAPDQEEWIIPVFHYGDVGAGVTGGLDEIWAEQCSGGTGVIVSGSELTWILNDGRDWVQIGA